MKKLRVVTAISGLLMASNALAMDVDVKITNLTNGIFFTPFLIGAHNAGADLFEPGMAASANLQAMAECGDIAGLQADLMAAAANVATNPAGGLLAPGASTSAMLSTAPSNDRLSIVSMLLPTNDAFAGLDGAMIPNKPGTYTFYLNAYDAGTEVNNELVAPGCTPGQPGMPEPVGNPALPLGGDAMATGGVTSTETNHTVHVHRGNLGDDNPNGGNSGVSNTRHRWQNPILKVELTVK